MSKRLVSFLLAFIMIIGSFTPVFANGIIINGGSEDKIVGENNSEELKSSITINNQNDKDKKQDEIHSSLVIDNNNTETENRLEVNKNNTLANVGRGLDNIDSIIENAKMTITTIKDDIDHSGDFVFKMEENRSRLIKRNISINTKKSSVDIEPGTFIIRIPLITNGYDFYSEEKLKNGSVVSVAENTGFDHEYLQENDGKTYIVFKNKNKINAGNSLDLNFTFTEQLNDFALTSGKTYETFLQIGSAVFSKINIKYQGIPLNEIIKSDSETISVGKYYGTITDEFFNFSDKYNANNYFISPLNSFFYGFLLRSLEDTGIPHGGNWNHRDEYIQTKPDAISGDDPKSTIQYVIYAPSGSVLFINSKEFLEEKDGKITIPYHIAKDESITRRLLVPKKYEKTKITIKVGYENISFKDSDRKLSILTTSNISLPAAKSYNLHKKKVTIKSISSSLKGQPSQNFGLVKDYSFENFYYKMKNYPKNSQSFISGLYFEMNIMSPVDLELLFDGYILRNANNKNELYFLPVDMSMSTLWQTYPMYIETDNGEIAPNEVHIDTTKKQNSHNLRLVYKNISGTIKNTWGNESSVRNTTITLPNNLTEDHFNNNEWEIFVKASYKIKDSKTGEIINPTFINNPNYPRYPDSLMNFVNKINKDLYTDQELNGLNCTDYYIRNISKFSNTLFGNNGLATASFLKEKDGKLFFEITLNNRIYGTMFSGKIYNVELGLKDSDLVLEDIVSVKADSSYNNIKESLEIKNPPQKNNNKINATFIDKNSQTLDMRDFYSGSTKGDDFASFSAKAIYSIDKNIYNKKLANEIGKISVRISNKTLISENNVEIENNPLYVNNNSVYLPYVDTGNMQYAISEVKTNDSKKFISGKALINANESYEYKLSIAAGSLSLSNIVIYNEIENAEPGFLNWKGDLVGVDCTEAKSLGYDIDVFASYKYNNDPLNIDKDWIPFKEADLSKVKTLAFKVSDSKTGNGELPPKRSLSVYIKMKTPNDSEIVKFQGKPTHAYNNMYTEWKPENSSEKTGIKSNTTKVSFQDSITDDVIAKVNHKININRTYSDGFTDKEKKENRIVILTDVKTGNKYVTNGNTIACVEPGKYSVTYITKKGVKAEGDETVEIIEEYKDSVNTINVNYSKSNDQGSGDGPGYVDGDSKENLFKMTVKNKDKKIIHIN